MFAISSGEKTLESVNPFNAALNPLSGVSFKLAMTYGVSSSIVMNVLSGKALISALTVLNVLPAIACRIGLPLQSGMISPMVSIAYQNVH